MEELHTEWLDEVNATEQSMNIYYTQRVEHITLTFFYIQQGVIVHTNRSTVTLKDACLNKQDVSKYIRDNRSHDKTIYKVYQVIQYNYTITPQQILDLERPDAKLEVIQPLRDIIFQDTIPCFNPLNELMFIMVPKKQNDSTKKTGVHKSIRMTRKHS